MKAIHDLGGVHGFGPIPTDSSIFHDNWEREIFAISKLLQLQGLCNVDEKRHAAERIPPSRYLQISYFEKWIDCIEILLIEKNIITREDLDSHYSSSPKHNTIPSDTELCLDLTKRVIESFKSDKLKNAPSKPTKFKVGDTVRLNSNNKFGHSRSPAYAQRCNGVVEKIFGTFPLPDSTAHGEFSTEPVYKVRFSAKELWGNSYSDTIDSVTLDLFESYLS